jgi:hypothetical protein
MISCGGGTFLLRQESTQRMRHRRGAELFAPANKAALSYVPHPARFAIGFQNFSVQFLEFPKVE